MLTATGSMITLPISICWKPECEENNTESEDTEGFTHEIARISASLAAFLFYDEQTKHSAEGFTTERMTHMWLLGTESGVITTNPRLGLKC